ncbi:MAG: FAD-binding protein, partial [Spirochaetaceae bacterium]|nr:FAD-binding protein [Spirochaetaceae bacterium]
DVIVAGFGGAGATAAITAADAGAKVLLLEKAPKGEEGGNTKVSGQGVLSPNNRERAITYYKNLRGNFGNQSDAVITAMVDGMMQNREWMVSLGMERARIADFPYPEYPEYEGADAMRIASIDNGNDSKFYQLLHKNVTDRAGKIDVWYASPAVQLIQDKETRIIHGVRVQNGGKTYNVRAINGVVLAVGGFENNDKMLEIYAQLPDAYSKGARYNTGDGIIMAIDVGAALWHMSTLAGPDVNFINPDSGIAQGYMFTNTTSFPIWTDFGAYNIINVGGDGTRFMNETLPTKHGHLKTGGSYFGLQVPQNAWCVFDEAARTSAKAYHAWSDGMVEEINKGWIVKADTIRELAALMGVPAAGLEKTVTDYNRYCAQGNDPDYHVDPKWLKPLSRGPFYAFPIKASLTNTQGGAERNERCEVLDVWGNPIPHLYSAGEFGSFYTDIYNGGGNLGECAFTGRIAGTNAAAPKNDISRSSVMGGKTPVNLSSDSGIQISLGAGEYLGKGMGMGGELIVKVRMDGSRIASIEVVQQHETVGIGDKAVTAIPAAIIRAQSTKVDTITGATVTSSAIIDAVNDALSKAR